MNNIIKEDLKIKGMSCGHCVKTVENELKKLPLASLNVAIGKVTMEYDNTKVNRESIIKAIEEAGYEAEQYEN